MAGEAPGPPLSAGASVPPLDHRVDGGPRRGVARGRQRFFRTYYAPNNAVAVGRRRRRHRRPSDAAPSAFSARIPANPNIPPLGDLSLPPTLGREIRETVYDQVPLPRIYFGFRAPVYGDPRLDALEVAGQILAGGKGSRLHRRLVRDERIAQDVALFTLGFIGGASVAAGWATVRPGVAVERVEAAFHEELERLAAEPVSDDELARASALIEADELGALQRVEERADRLSMYATLFDAPGLINEMLRPLPGGHAGGHPRGRGGHVPARQPARPDLPARDARRAETDAIDRPTRTEPQDEEVAA